MRLGRRVKFNMIIAILLCMAFVVNFGVTLATTDYKFKASSVNSVTGDTTINYDAYANFASVQGATGKYVYTTGTTNSQLSINYGFNTKYNYDLKINFTATYTNPNHKATDFSINFVNRDDWCIDMGSVNGWKTDNGNTVADASQTYYTMTSSTNTLSGTMYYMGTRTGSSTLPIISGVTFHTSPNNSYSYIGDVLTITLTPEFVKAETANYGTNHAFYSASASQTLFSNWATYMKSQVDNTVQLDTSVMVYNAYVDDARSLEYSYDSAVVTDGDVNTALTTQPNYANTAYRYQINTTTNNNVTTTTRTYNAITAGNRYYGGLGLYVIPADNLITVSVSFSYNWQKDNKLAGTTDSNMVTFDYSSDIQTIQNNGVSYNYYRTAITKPTYINVLDYIMLTAEDYKTIISNGYSLILKDVSVGLVTDANQIVTDDVDALNTWTGGYTKPIYDIHNSTSASPVLARVKDVYAGSKNYEANISVSNNNATPITVTGFTVSSKLWYGAYPVNETTKLTAYKETPMGAGYLNTGGLHYDINLWNVSDTNGVFTFTAKSGSLTYIPSGYSLTLIDGITIPQMEACQTATEANDFWCALELTSISTATEGVSYTNTTTTGVEVVTEGYYTAINTSKVGKIYIKNNTRQVITQVSLSNLAVYVLNENTTFLPRDRSTGNDADYTLTEHLEGDVSIKPGEMVLAYTITPTTANEDAIIYDFVVTTTMKNQEEISNIDLVYDEYTKLGMLINNSTNYYEFRLVSTSDISSKLVNSNQFVEREVDGTYYYYYKGIICPSRCVQVFNSFALNVEVEYITHNSTTNATHYVASNYVAWGLSDTDDKAWFDAMKKLYEEPTATERENATIITLN